MYVVISIINGYDINTFIVFNQILCVSFSELLKMVMMVECVKVIKRKFKHTIAKTLNSGITILNKHLKSLQ